MKKEDCFNEEINPDGISIILKNLNKVVWNNGYYFPTDDGIWYEIYVNDEIKVFYPDINLSNEEHYETFGGFHDLNLENYIEYNQITFFVPNGEKDFTLENLTEILC
jgi:hypothetical protein